MDNARYGGWDDRMAERLLRASREVFGSSGLDAIGTFRA